ncbi:MAG: C40 family peptidase [Scandinavium sp.]|uniref:C40 family peptidase n=1 Tax=Scandinavium sp. TaxID=2830653 RepID=UPI003F2A2B86
MWNVNNSSLLSTPLALLCVLLAGWLGIMPGTVLAKPKPATVKTSKPVARKTHDKKVQARINNRKKLLAKSRLKLANVPLTPSQKRKIAARKRAERTENREFLTEQVHWKSGALGRQWPLVQMSEKMEHSLVKVMKKLKKQLGKPYVWGGASPKTGFDCSGLVWYAYTTSTKRKLPRTANGMYTAKNLKRVKKSRLHRGDLIFFGIHKKTKADHVGVYLGEGKFIEAPRTGLNVRISHLTDDFWQDHYLGSRRVIYDEHG